MNAILIFTVLLSIIAIILAFFGQKFKIKGNPLIDKINDILPQIQCAQCDYPGCKPYAQAIAKGEVEINQCSPGGQETINALAELLNVEILEPRTQNKIFDDKAVAVINEKDCIGCTLCIKACPVDAILGTSKMMTTVLASECTGCELCIEPCPVDCIKMIKLEPTIANFVPKIKRIQ